MCLIQDKYRAAAEGRARAIEQQGGYRPGRVVLWAGDIAEPDLGLGDRVATLQQETLEVYHLAAVYDLAVSREVGMRINAEGTRHMLEMAAGCPSLQRFQYMSTCFVSGRHGGTFTEDDLEKGQQFNNYYEESKYRAEREVQRYREDGLPTTIYRPSIVVGHAETGATQKYDGPYYLAQWMLRWRDLVPMPVVGDPQQYEVNVVPSSFVIDAVSYLSGLEHSEGQVYHLCDPQAPTADVFLDIMARAADRRLLRLPVPPVLARAAVEYVPGLYQWMGILPNAIDYFTHPTQYVCTNTLRDLQGSGIACPPFASYARNLVRFMQQHPDVSARAMA